MYRRIDDFLNDWAEENKGTQAILNALTDETLNQRVTPDGRSLAKLGWHIAQCIHMATEAGLAGVRGPGENDPIPTSAKAIADAYAGAAASLAEAVKGGWTDADLPVEVPMYGEQWARGRVLSVIIRHEAHHRGQMTVLMRQAGLKVPGVYGPAREEWVNYGMSPQD